MKETLATLTRLPSPTPDISLIYGALAIITQRIFLKSSSVRVASAGVEVGSLSAIDSDWPGTQRLFFRRFGYKSFAGPRADKVDERVQTSGAAPTKVQDPTHVLQPRRPLL